MTPEEVRNFCGEWDNRVNFVWDEQGFGKYTEKYTPCPYSEALRAQGLRIEKNPATGELSFQLQGPTGTQVEYIAGKRIEYPACLPGEHWENIGGIGGRIVCRPPEPDISPLDVAASFAVNAVQLATNPIPYVINTYAGALTQTLAEENIMALNIGGILQGAAGVLSGVSSGNYLSALGSGLSGAAAAFAPQAQPVYAATPAYSMPGYSLPSYPQQQQPMAQPVGAFAVGAAVASRIAAMTAPILAKIAVKLGLRARPSLTRAMDIVRKAAKLLGSPEAVAVALGITTAELATLITAQSSRKRRRMNPANSKALRRAARRIKSFHRLCTHTDVLKGRGRSRRVASCGTCKKSPCRC